MREIIHHDKEKAFSTILYQQTGSQLDRYECDDNAYHSALPMSFAKISVIADDDSATTISSISSSSILNCPHSPLHGEIIPIPDDQDQLELKPYLNNIIIDAPTITSSEMDVMTVNTTELAGVDSLSPMHEHPTNPALSKKKKIESFSVNMSDDKSLISPEDTYTIDKNTESERSSIFHDSLRAMMNTHCVCFSQNSNGLNSLVHFEEDISYSQQIMQKHEALLSLLCDVKSEPDDIYLAVNNNPNLLMIKGEKDNRLPLHVLCDCDSRDDIIVSNDLDHIIENLRVRVSNIQTKLQTLTSYYIDACFWPDMHGDLPCHLLARRLREMINKFTSTINRSNIEIKLEIK